MIASSTAGRSTLFVSGTLAPHRFLPPREVLDNEQLGHAAADQASELGPIVL